MPCNTWLSAFGMTINCIRLYIFDPEVGRADLPIFHFLIDSKMVCSKFPLISVIIPVYNGAKVLKRSIMSVVNDKYEYKEIIIVDDGSSDNTHESYSGLLVSKGIKRVKYIKQENAGANSARNNGLRQASGSYVQFLDCDDELINNKLFYSIKEFLRAPKLVSVYTDAVSVLNGVKQDKVISANHQHVQALADRNPLCFTCGLQTNLPVWNREFLIGNQLYWDESLPCWQESEYYVRVITSMKNAGLILHLPLEGVLLHRDNSVASESISSGYWSEKYILGQHKAITKILEHLAREGIENKNCNAQFENYLKLLAVRSIVGGSSEAWREISLDIHRRLPWNSPLFLSTSIPYPIIHFLYLTYKKLKSLKV